MPELITKFQKRPNSKNHKNHWAITVFYKNSEGHERPLGMVFLDEAKVDLLHTLGFEHEDLVEEEKQ